MKLLKHRKYRPILLTAPVLAVFGVIFVLLHSRLSDISPVSSHLDAPKPPLAPARTRPRAQPHLSATSKVSQKQVTDHRLRGKHPAPTPSPSTSGPSPTTVSSWEKNVGDHQLTVFAYSHGVFHIRFQRPGARSHTAEVITSKPIEMRVTERPDGVEMVGEGSEALRLRYGKGDWVEAEVIDHLGGVVTRAKLFDRMAEVVFPRASMVSGLAERATSLALPDGVYRLWNLDVNHYATESNAPLYGSVPYLMGVAPGEAAGVMIVNPSEGTVKVQKGDKGGVTTSWTFAAGCLDMVTYPGPTPMEVVQEHSATTGLPYLPPVFSIGYHQCRWNYRDVEDVLSVNQGFLNHDMPCDAIWLDIEHTDRKHYFTWDPTKFAFPKVMQEKLEKTGRHLVTITDPHISRSPGYFVHEEAEKRGYYVKTRHGASYEGHCWPGGSSWVDFFNPEARDWYSGLFSFDRYEGSTPILHSWIDMNEPSVFSGPEITMHGDAVHMGNVPHREVHNMYGHLQAMATHEGLLRRFNSKDPAEKQRGFVLSRSFFAGTQRYAAIWTGDNQAKWSHLKASVPMLLLLSVSGIPFVGADVGGFFDNPSPKLLARWYQLGAYYPFFRGHSHIETRRREPWLLPADMRELVRCALKLRYSILPYIYTLFFQSSMEGLPIIRPVFFEFPKLDVQHLKEDLTFMLGPSILVTPVTSPDAKEINVFFPAPADADLDWYRWPDHACGVVTAPPGGESKAVKVQDDDIPAYQRGGTIVARKKFDHVTSTTDLREKHHELQVAVGKDGKAVGYLYLDDGATLNHTIGAFNYKKFVFDNGTLTVQCAHGEGTDSPFASFPPDIPYVPVEGGLGSVVLMFHGEPPSKWSSYSLAADGKSHPLQPRADRCTDSNQFIIEIKDLDLPIYGPWTLRLST